MQTEQPLEGLKVIDCSTLLAGPWTATLLGDFGADVIKIEHPDGGDSIRHHGDYDEELQWLTVGRNKKSVPIDLHDEEGQAILHDLVEEADVFIENFRPGRLEEWNLGWETLSQINPNLVMVRATGFGQTGPYKDLPGFGTLAEAMSGFANLTGEADAPPSLPPFGLADSIAALHSTFATMFALYWRDVNGGTGQYIDTSILEPIFGAIMQSHVVEYSERGIVRKRMGNRNPYSAPRNTYKTKDDEWVAISTSSESIAKRVLKMVGGEDLVNDPRFQTMKDRVTNVEELDDIIQEWFSQFTRAEAIAKFEEADAAIAPVYDIEDIFEDDFFWERDALVEVEDETHGEVTMQGVFPKMSKTPGRIDHAGPPLGAHTLEVLLAETSLTEEEIHELERDGILTTTNRE
jgi:formyl-CoA transferase